MKKDALGFKGGQKNCHNCIHAQFVGSQEDFKCTKFGISFSTTEHASTFVCKRWDDEVKNSLPK